MLPQHVVENQLERNERRWRMLRFVKRSAIVWSVMMLAVLVIGAAATIGLITAMPLAIVLYIITVIVGFFCWGIHLLLTLMGPIDRAKIAATIEKEQPWLLDRLNTLVYLDKSGTRRTPLVQGITQQTAQVFSRIPPSICSPRQAIGHIAVLAVLSALTVLFYRHYDPLEHIRAAERAAVAHAKPPLEQDLAIPENSEEAANESEQPKEWVEIRISEPGRDVRASRFEIIPVVIEAISSQPFTQLSWSYAINGGEFQQQPLPSPEDPNYASYERQLDLELMGAQDWDVVGYFAEAQTADDQSHRTNIYFVEVFPPREELEKVPGGTDGEAYRRLKEMTTMIERQENVIRGEQRTEQLLESSDDRAQLQRGLAREEQDLSNTANNISAELSEIEDAQPLREQLEKSSQALNAAGEALRDNKPDVKRQAPWQALSELTAARKRLHELITQHPEQFTNEGDSTTAEDGAEQPSEAMNAQQWREFREAMEQLARDQQQLSEQAASEMTEQLAEKQQALHERLEQQLEKHPDLDLRTEAAAADANKSLEQAEQSLRSQEANAPQKIAEAAQKLEQLAERAAQREAAQTSNEAKNLQRELEKGIAELEAIEKTPASFAPGNLEKQSQEAKDLAQKVDDFAKQNPQQTPRLQEQLSPQQREQIQTASDKLGAAQSDAEKQHAAGDVKQGLQQLKDAMSADQAQQAAQRLQQKLDQQVSDMQQSQDQLEEARQFVKQALGRQREIQREAAPQSAEQFPQIAEQQEQLQKEFEEFEKQHPETMRAAQGACENAKHSMQQCSAALRSGQPEAQQSAQDAASSLQEIDDALAAKQQSQNHADMNRMRQAVEQAGKQLEESAQQPPGQMDEQTGKLGETAKSLLDKLKQLASQPAMQKQMSRGTSRALSEEQMQQLAEQAQRLVESLTPEERAQLARDLGQGMQKLGEQMQSQADQSQRDDLRETGSQALARGLRQLQSLAKRQQMGRPLPVDEQQQMRDEATSFLVEGIKDLYGHNENTRHVIARLNDELKDPQQPVDLQLVRQLVAQVQDLRREVIQAPREEQPEADITNIDPSRLPPAYGKAIEKYFQRLSDQK